MYDNVFNLYGKHRSLDTEILVQDLLKHLRTALNHEKRKASSGLSAYDESWEDWFGKLQAGALPIHRPSTLEWWLIDSDLALQEEVMFARDKKMIVNPALG